MNIKNYSTIAIGTLMLLYAIYKLALGINDGFQFHIRNLELRGTKALVVNLAFILFALIFIFSGIKDRRNESNNNHSK